MKNLMKKFRKSNKGFTLVELIIVVAIIAILTAVVAPQYVKYVEKSRDAVVEAAANEVLTMAKAEAAVGSFTTGGSITVSKAGIASTGCVYDGNFGDSIDDFIAACGDQTDLKKSKSTKTFTIAVTTTDATKSGTTWSD